MLLNGAARKADRLISTWKCDSANFLKGSDDNASSTFYLSYKRRLYLCELGDFDALLSECRTIQLTLSTSRKWMSHEKLSKTFASLMLRGKVNAALRLLDQQSPGGVLPLTDNVYEKETSDSKPVDTSVMMSGEILFVDPALIV